MNWKPICKDNAKDESNSSVWHDLQASNANCDIWYQYGFKSNTLLVKVDCNI